MKLGKGRGPRPPAADATDASAKSAAKGKAHAEPKREAKAEAPVDLERALIEEVAGTHASAAALRKIVERVLGAGPDSDVNALVQKLSKVAKSDSALPY
ncbi:MAG TPA: hypothetical protein VGO62_09140 [Myxococcota bacterium]|jgi:hypothetical protein